MALADILRRIDQDTSSEVACIVADAEQAAVAIRQSAEQHSSAARETVLARTRTDATEEARVRVAGARLRGRDRLLAEKRVLIGRAMAESEKRIYSLPDEKYAALIACEATRHSREGETLLIGEDDAQRLTAHLPGALEAADATLVVGGVTPEIARGVVVVDDRMQVEVSVNALLQERREELEALANDRLFGSEE